MPVLKKGAKGKDVNALQTLLNKNGAKLKVDGIFGPLTEAAVKSFQKKAGLGVDGKVGDNTLASLKYGGPLPEMKVPPYAKRKSELSSAWTTNQTAITKLLAIQKELEALTPVLSKQVPIGDKNFVDSYKLWDQIGDNCKKILDKQKEFEALRLKDPAKAAKLAKECEALDAEIDAIGKSKIGPATKKTTVAMGAIEKATDPALKKINSEWAAVKKLL